MYYDFLKISFKSYTTLFTIPFFPKTKQVHLYKMLWFTILVFLAGLWIYFIYPFFVIKPQQKGPALAREIVSHLPSVEIIIPAYLDFENLSSLVQDSFVQDYPKELLKITLVIDGQIPVSFKNQIEGQVQIIHSIIRMGKANALNRAVAASSSDIIVFLDANIRIKKDVVTKMVDALLSDQDITLVFGRKIVEKEQRVVGVESLYWDYEHRVKMLENEAGCLFAATGELLAMYRNKYNQLPNHIILDDMYQSVEHIQQSGKLKYLPEVISFERASQQLLQEVQRKIRIGRGAAQLLGQKGWLPFDSFQLNFHFWQRKLARWLFFPFIVVLWSIALFCYIFSANLVLLILGIWLLFFMLYLFKTNLSILTKFSRYVIYFPIMQLALFGGFISYYLGFKSHLWNKISR